MNGGGRQLGIVGASGFLGGELACQAARRGWRVTGFSRSPREPDEEIAEWRRWEESPDLGGLDAVVNLAGDPIDRRWTECRKKRFRESRVGVTETLVRAIESMNLRPTVFLNGSAVGIYGDRDDQVLTEQATADDDYLAELCADWEKAADPATAMGVRVLKWRTGIVLGSGGAAWGKMRAAFKFGLGGRLGDGRQWMPWIHVEDLIGGMLHALEGELSGPVNGVAPEPERNEDLTRKVATALHRPAFMHAPGWALRVGLGGFADALLASQRVVPQKLLGAGYRFRFPTLESALEDLV